jgi:hypothetical protein
MLKRQELVNVIQVLFDFISENEFIHQPTAETESASNVIIKY